MLVGHIGKMVAQTPNKRGMVGGVESSGKKSKDKEYDLGPYDVQIGEEAEEQPKWNPRPIADPIDPIQIGVKPCSYPKRRVVE